jgi:hypothetical protein
MKNKLTGRSYNFVKALIDSETQKQYLINERFIRFNLSKLYIEDFIKPTIQCRKCKGLGHIEKTCNKEYKCGKCGENHMENTCQRIKKMQNVQIENKITRSFIEAVKSTKKQKI